METEFSSSLLIFEVLGLQYFSLKLLSCKTLWTRPSIVRTVYMILLLIFMTGISVWFVTSEAVLETSSTVTAKNVLTFALQHSLNLGLILVVIVSMVQSYFTTPKVKKIYLNFKEITDIALDHFNIKKDFKQVRKGAIKRITVVVSSFVVLHLTSFFFRFGSVNDTIPMLVGAIPVFYLIMVGYKYVFYVAMVNHQMRCVLRLLEEAFKRPLIITKNIENIKFNLTNTQIVKKYENPMTKLLAVRRTFNLVYENGTLINESNGLTILIVLVDLVIAITASEYEIFVVVVGGLPPEKLIGKILIAFETNKNIE